MWKNRIIDARHAVMKLGYTAEKKDALIAVLKEAWHEFLAQTTYFNNFLLYKENRIDGPD